MWSAWCVDWRYLAIATLVVLEGERTTRRKKQNIFQLSNCENLKTVSKEGEWDCDFKTIVKERSYVKQNLSNLNPEENTSTSFPISHHDVKTKVKTKSS